MSRIFVRKDRLSRQLRVTLLGLAALLCASAASAAGGSVIYVHQLASGQNNGSSWADAFIDLQDALASAQAGDEIWVAAGTYKPDRGTGDRGIAFEPPGNVSLLGGFVGWETDREQRDWVKNETVLSGDLLGDDDVSATGQSNCCDVTLQPGCEDAECAAIVYTRRPQCAQSWDLTCALMARDFCCEACRTTYCDNSSNVIHMIDVLGPVAFDALTVRGADGDGLVSVRSGMTVDRCRFTANAQVALFTSFGSATVARCRFVENGLFDDTLGGGLGVWNEYNQAVVSDCEFLGNRGAGMVTRSSAPIRRCTFRDNTGISSALTIVEGVPIIADCAFIGNRNVTGGAVSTAYLTSVRVDNCVFIGNYSDFDGGAIYSNSGGGLTVVNSLFAGNSARGVGGAISNNLGTLHMSNSTVFGNRAGNEGGIGTNDTELTNCVLWGNEDDFAGSSQRAQVHSFEPPGIRYSIVQNWTGSWGGAGNSGVDPMFVDADGADDIAGTEDDDLRLSPGSPAINAGDPNSTGLPPTDLDGHARVLCDRVDIGAYEFGIGDFNCDQSVDLSDFAAWSYCMTGPSTAETAVPQGCEAFDFNADQAVDLLDFAEFQGVFTVP